MTAPSTNSSPPCLQLDPLIAEYWNSSCMLIEFTLEHPRVSIPVPLNEGRSRGESRLRAQSNRSKAGRGLTCGARSSSAGLGTWFCRQDQKAPRFLLEVQVWRHITVCTEQQHLPSHTSQTLSNKVVLSFENE